jgi:hypothetical protein
MINYGFEPKLLMIVLLNKKMSVRSGSTSETSAGMEILIAVMLPGDRCDKAVRR